MEFEVFSVFVIVVVVFAIFLVIAGVKSVSQGSEYTIERFGRYTHTLKPGLHLIVPVIDRVGSKMNMMENVRDVPSQEVITKDNAMVQVDGVQGSRSDEKAESTAEGKTRTVASRPSRSMRQSIESGSPPSPWRMQ